jgi:hypothetical protein
MKYRLTPFHFLTLYFLGAGIYDLYVLSKLKHDTELGELIPFFYFGFSLVTLFIDLIIQVTFRLTIKDNPKRIIYIVESSLIIIGLLWVWLEFFPTVHYQ